MSAKRKPKKQRKPRDTNYTVGYGKPPKEHQWPKGVSGNMKGRRPKGRNFDTEFEEELNEIVEVTENGQRRKMTKRRVLLKKMMDKAFKGDFKALDTLLRLDRHQSGSQLPDDVEDHLSASEAKRLQDYVDRQARKLSKGGDG